jgi:hypothetical protein
VTFRFRRIQTCFSLTALHDEGASARDEAHHSIQYGDRPLQFLLIAFVPFDLLTYDVLLLRLGRGEIVVFVVVLVTLPMAVCRLLS